MNSLQTIGVIGAGTMGSGSAQVCAHAGTSVSITDVNEQRVAHRRVEAAAALVGRLGKTPVIKDSPGDAMKRLLCPIPNEAGPAYSQGLAKVEDGAARQLRRDRIQVQAPLPHNPDEMPTLC
jgi:3-hydroxyacyl-CoA dehydrogenase